MKRVIAMKRWVGILLTLAAVESSAQMQTAVQAEQTLRRALDAMATKQQSGGWAMAWSVDGQITWGEYRSIPSQWITVQPPATPGIAAVYLHAARILKDPACEKRAAMARDALIAVMTPDDGFPYEADPAGQKIKQATFDDNTTTGALDFLIELWQHTKGELEYKAVLRVGEFLLILQR